jgi:hypothetical protein
VSDDQVAELSIEVCHLYGDRLGLQALVDGLQIAKPIVDAMRNTSVGRSISVCILIDDYFRALSIEREQIRDMVEEASAKTSLPIHYIVSEAALAKTVRALTDRLLPIPYPGAGSQKSEDAVGRYLSNLEGNRLSRRRGGSPAWLQPFDDSSLKELSEDNPPGLGHRVRRGQHEVDLLVELWSSDPTNRANRYSCSVLAAWWQLVRLGYLREAEKPSIPAETIALDSSIPFVAKRTLSILDPDYIEIEHAVRTILDSFVPSLHSGMWGDGDSDDSSDSTLSKVAYSFIDGGFFGTDE